MNVEHPTSNIECSIENGNFLRNGYTVKQYSKEPNRPLGRNTAPENGGAPSADGDLGLDLQIRRRYSASPGVVPMEATLGLAGRFSRLGKGRLPLLNLIQRRWASAGGECSPGRSALPYVLPLEPTGRLSPAPETVQRAIGRPLSKAMHGSAGSAAVGHDVAPGSKTGKGKMGGLLIRRYIDSPGVASTKKTPSAAGKDSRLSDGRSSLATEIQRRLVPPGFHDPRPIGTFHGVSADRAMDAAPSDRAVKKAQPSGPAGTADQGLPIMRHTAGQRAYNNPLNNIRKHAEASTGSDSETGAGSDIIRPKISLAGPGPVIQKTTATETAVAFKHDIDGPGAVAPPTSDTVIDTGTVKPFSKAALPKPVGRIQRSDQDRATPSNTPANHEPKVSSGPDHGAIFARRAGRKAHVFQLATTDAGGLPLQRGWPAPNLPASGEKIIRRTADSGLPSRPSSLEMPLARPSVASGVRAGVKNSRIIQARSDNGSHPNPPAITSASSSHSSLPQAYPDKTNMSQMSRPGNYLQPSRTIPLMPFEADVGNEEKLDVEELVDKVMRKFLRRIQIEGERGGRQPWP